MVEKNKRRARLAELFGLAKKNDAQVRAIFDKADQRDGEETDDEIVEIKRLNGETKSYLQEAEELKAVLDIRGEIEGRASGGSEIINSPGHAGGQAAPQIATIGQKFLNDPEVKAWIEKLGPTGNGKRIDSPRVDVQSFMRTLLTGSGATSAGAFVFPDFKPLVDQFYQRPLTVRDLITIGETGSDTVEYVRITGVTNQAAPTAESANVTDGDTSGKKPESAMAFLRVTETVKTIAHWIPATNRALQDAGQLKTYIDQFLQYGIQEELEDQIINGSGSGENFTGIYNTPSRNFQAFSSDVLATARKARTQVRINGRTIPTAYVMHPNDWESIDLLKDSQGRYYFGGPLEQGTPRLWGLPVIESEACTEGEALCGNFKLAVMWDRLQSQVSVSNSHNDFFVRNMVAILAEMRAAFGVIRAKAFTQFETVSGGS